MVNKLALPAMESLFPPISRIRLSLRGLFSLLVVLLAAVPLVFVIYSSAQLDTQGWVALWSSRLPRL